MSRSKNKLQAKEFIEGLLEYTEITVCTKEDLQFALLLNMADFEDAMQVAAAKAENCTAVITRNIADYKNSPIAVILPLSYAA